MVCGCLRWFSVICGGLSFSHTGRRQQSLSQTPVSLTVSVCDSVWDPLSLTLTLSQWPWPSTPILVGRDVAHREIGGRLG